MGLLKAAFGAAGGVMADQWKEYFYCESIEPDVLVVKGRKRTSEKRSSNVHAEDNIISNGSIVAVNDGQCMIIVEQGKVAEICAEPGEFTYDTSTEPTIFTGNLGDSVKATFKNIGKRFTFGGDTAKDQRVYYFNTKEIIGNKYGTANAVPFRVVDNNIGLDLDATVKCFGEYSYKIVDPILFYTNVCGNVEDEYERATIDSQLKTELLTALQPAFAKISEMGIRYSMLPGHTTEIADALNEVLTKSWKEKRGLAIASFGVSSIKLSDEYETIIREKQRDAVNRNPNMAAATLVGAQAQAMQDAAKNQGAGGAMFGFAGMNMAGMAGGMNAQNLFGMGQQPQYQQQQGTQYQQPLQQYQQQGQPQQAAPAAGSWKCECGTMNTGKFCANCGKPMPAPAPAAGSWTCECGTVNTGKFCQNCGKPAPAPAGPWKCECGTENTGKFCANCGKPRP